MLASEYDLSPGGILAAVGDQGAADLTVYPREMFERLCAPRKKKERNLRVNCVHDGSSIWITKSEAAVKASHWQTYDSVIAAKGRAQVDNGRGFSAADPGFGSSRGEGNDELRHKGEKRWWVAEPS